MTGFCPLASLSWPQVLATASRNGTSKLHAKPIHRERIRTSLSREFPQICSFRRRSTRTKRLSPGSNHTVPSDPHKPYFQHVTAALQAGKAKLTITWDLGMPNPDDLTHDSINWLEFGSSRATSVVPPPLKSPVKS